MGTFSIKYIVYDDKGVQYYTVLCNETGELHDFRPYQIVQSVHKHLNNCKIADNQVITDAIKVYVGKDVTIPCNILVSGWNDLDTWCRKHKRFDILSAYIAGNNPKQPFEITGRNGKEAKFKCQSKLQDGSLCGHEWKQIVCSVTNNDGRASICPACRARKGQSKRVIPGINDLETYCKKTNNQDLLADYNLANNKQPASQVSANQAIVVNWKCHTCGFEWQIQPSRRVRNKQLCPKCQASKGKYTSLMVGANDLETWCKENNRLDILNAWASDSKFKPSEVSAKTDTVEVKIHCQVCGKKTVTKPYLLVRSELSTVCTNCRATGTSVPQIVLDRLLKKRFIDTEYRYKLPYNYELDSYIPSLNLGIEYNGIWHSTDYGQIRDSNKMLICNQLGVKILWVQEHSNKIEASYNNGVIDVWSHENRDIKTYQFILDTLQKLCGIQVEPISDKEFKQALDYANSIIRRESVPNNITITHPEIAQTWDYEKNGNLRPEMFTRGQHQKVFWKCNTCKVPHSYEMDIHHRCRGEKGQGCPVQQGKVIQPGVNDLKTLHPRVVRFWDYEKNNADGLRPDLVQPNQHKLAWWKCPNCGYERQDTINLMQKLKKCKACRIKI